MSQFYTPEYIDENYPEHCRTSCSDEHPINAEVNGHGCLRCNALLFQKQEAEHEEITRLRAELAKVTWQRNEARADLAASRAESERLSSMIDHQRDEAMEMERMLRAELADSQSECGRMTELCRRLYVELFHCDKQMTNTRGEEGEPLWTTGKTVLDVLQDAKKALDAALAGEVK